MQKTPFGDPAPALYQLLVHDRNLPGRATETDEAKLQPESQGLPEADRLRCLRQCFRVLRGCLRHVEGTPLSKLASNPSKMAEAAVSN